MKTSQFNFGKWSLSRLVRWTVLLVVGGWVLLNWHGDRTVNELAIRYTYPESKWVTIENQAIHYRDKGKGPVLLLLHDEGSSMHTWARWTDTLSQKYRVISVDLPGFGLTGPNLRGSYSSFMYASFIQQLTDSLRLSTFSLAGVGMGAQIAWFYAAERPGRVEKLVLIGSKGFEKSSASWVTIFAQTPVLNRVMWVITPKEFFRLLLEEVYADDRMVTDSLVIRHFELTLRPGNRKAFTSRASVRDNRPPVDFIEKIRVPTLIMWGAEDALISTQHAYDFHRQIRGSFIKIYQNSGHWPQEEWPVESAMDVQAFLEDRF
jgi:pimeloyl-ACP methyl ester carboxylesterase